MRLTCHKQAWKREVERAKAAVLPRWEGSLYGNDVHEVGLRAWPPSSCSQARLGACGSKVQASGASFGVCRCRSSSFFSFPLHTPFSAWHALCAGRAVAGAARLQARGPASRPRAAAPRGLR